MTISRQTAIGLLILTAMVTSSIWLLTGLSTGTTSGVGPRGPAWYFTGAQLLATGRDGTVSYTVDATRIVQDPANGSAVLQAPLVRWADGDTSPLSISADTGRANEVGILMLDSDVRILDESGDRIEVRTAWLRIDTRAETATTDADILVFHEQGELRGTGLAADMKAGTIVVLSAVRGRYAR